MRLSSLFAPLSLSLAVACASSPPPAPVETPVATATTAVATATTAAAEATPPAPPPPPAPVAPTPAVKFTGFSTPESVLYDAANDRYLVSNINGSPVDADNNGFISVLSPDGAVTTLKWIEGGAKKVKLNAPKGLAIVGNVLYVADIDTVRMFDLKSGAAKGEVKLPGATFTNDVAAGADGKVYASDSGLTLKDGNFAPTGTDAVWVIEKGKAKAFAKSAELGRPNGLLVDGTSVWVVTFGSGELYRLDEKGAKVDAVKLPTGGLDGLVKVGDKLLVSSWEGSQVFVGTPASFVPAYQVLQAPADIGFDTKRSRVLVPRFMDNLVEAYDLAQ
jgi:hypothetical protein